MFLIRNRWIAPLLGMLITIGVSDAAEALSTQPSATVELLSVSVNRPLSTAAMKRLFKYPSGSLLSNDLTSITLHLHSPDTRLVGLKEGDIKVDRIRDDKGTDLAVGSRVHLISPLTIGANPISGDLHHLFVGISSQKTPATEATRLIIDGTISPLFASGEKTVAPQKLSMRVGATADFGPIQIRVERLQVLSDGKSLWLTLNFKDHPEVLKEIHFSGTDGEDIPYQVKPQFSPSFLPDDAVEHTYRLAKIPSEVTVGGAVYLSTDKRPVPFHLDAGIGL